MIINRVKVFLTDDHEMILPGLKMAVESIDGFHVTGRENEILKMVSGGMKGKEICIELRISGSTLKSHKSNIMKKLNVSTTRELMLYAL